MASPSLADGIRSIFRRKGLFQLPRAHMAVLGSNPCHRPEIVESYVPAKKKEKFENIPIEANSGDTLGDLVHDIKQLWTAMPQHYASRKQHCRVDKQLWIEDGTWTLVTLAECKKRVQAALKARDIEKLQKTRVAMRDILESVCHGHKT